MERSERNSTSYPWSDIEATSPVQVLSLSVSNSLSVKVSASALSEDKKCSPSNLPDRFIHGSYSQSLSVLTSWTTLTGRKGDRLSVRNRGGWCLPPRFEFRTAVSFEHCCLYHGALTSVELFRSAAVDEFIIRRGLHCENSVQPRQLACVSLTERGHLVALLFGNWEGSHGRLESPWRRIPASVRLSVFGTLPCLTHPFYRISAMNCGCDSQTVVRPSWTGVSQGHIPESLAIRRCWSADHRVQWGVKGCRGTNQNCKTGRNRGHDLASVGDLLTSPSSLSGYRLGKLFVLHFDPRLWPFGVPVGNLLHNDPPQCISSVLLPCFPLSSLLFWDSLWLTTRSFRRLICFLSSLKSVSSIWWTIRRIVLSSPCFSALLAGVGKWLGLLPLTPPSICSRRRPSSCDQESVLQRTRSYSFPHFLLPFKTDRLISLLVSVARSDALKTQRERRSWLPRSVLRVQRPGLSLVGSQSGAHIRLSRPRGDNGQTTWPRWCLSSCTYAQRAPILACRDSSSLSCCGNTGVFPS